MERVRAIFQGVDDPRKSNAKKHDLIEMLAVALLATLSGKSPCSSFARYAKVNCEFLKGFLGAQGRSAEPRRVLRPVRCSRS